MLYLLLGCAFAFALFNVLLIIYRSTLHPLSKFPGPKLATCSYLYEFWFDIVQNGRYTHEIARLHKIYGPIIRINPDELHCDDASFVDEVYASGKRKRNKPQHFLAGFPGNAHLGVTLTGDHDLHRLRRGSINKFFSRSQVTQLEHLVKHNAEKLCNKIISSRDGHPFDLWNLYSCFTADVITEYCFGESSGFLDRPPWEPNYRSSVNALFRPAHLFRHFPWLKYPADLIPLCVLRWISQDLELLARDFSVTIPQRIRLAKATTTSLLKSQRPTIFSSLLTSDLPDSEKSIKRLTGEATAIMVAGTETVALTLSLYTFYLLSNPTVYKSVRNELLSIVPESSTFPSWHTLEKQPYLTAVLLETLRLGNNVPGRSPRTATEEDLIYRGSWLPEGTSRPVSVCHVIPRGYAIGMSPYILHTNDTLFPNPHEFDPSRWLQDGNINRELERHLFSFSKGSRMCVGIQLAWCELYIGAAMLTLRVFPFVKLYKTSLVDVQYDHDEVIAKPSAESKGIRISMVAQ
ncbi:hypothetical protein O1611_g1790 [Lasiodiplodia mahajangana]|uniref:Uncharacterized protein n=1 Tax=Lasiodiplodia mahajangana TaxID=1108764 RepID=A0ACC2JWZ9_9PEZI|nr:hypothetical protein O1611_g1790 [Lasiodiplodia mahajangana]